MMMDGSDQLGHTAALTFWDFDALQCIKAESRTWDAKRSEGSSSTHVNPSTAQPQTESAVLARNPWKANTLTSVTSIPHMQLRLTLGYLRSGRNVEGTEDVDLVQLGTTTEVAMLPECRVLICSSIFDATKAEFPSIHVSCNHPLANLLMEPIERENGYKIFTSGR